MVYNESRDLFFKLQFPPLAAPFPVTLNQQRRAQTDVELVDNVFLVDIGRQYTYLLFHFRCEHEKVDSWKLLRRVIIIETSCFVYFNFGGKINRFLT